jgi:hypothetical protein
MSSITGADGTQPSGAALTPQQQAELGLLGGSTSAPLTSAPLTSANETPQQEADAALVQLSPASTASGIAAELAAGATPQEAEASALVSQLASDITASGPAAASIYSQLSARAAYSLVKA